MKPNDMTAVASAVADSTAPHVANRLKLARLNALAARRARDPLAALFLREQEARDYLGAVHGWGRERRNDIAMEPADALRLAAEIAEGNVT